VAEAGTVHVTTGTAFIVAVIVACAVSAYPQLSAMISLTVDVPAALIRRPTVESDSLSIPVPTTVY
jgi:hypothetical protein